jgi:hypothetical protein
VILQSRGLRVSVAGGILVFISALSMLVLPDLVAAAGMLIGACAVGGGFAWTMLEFYTAPNDSPPDA